MLCTIVSIGNFVPRELRAEGYTEKTITMVIELKDYSTTPVSLMTRLPAGGIPREGSIKKLIIFRKKWFYYGTTRQHP